MDRSGIRSPEKTPHALRHTHATAMWEGGMHELALQQYRAWMWDHTPT